MTNNNNTVNANNCNRQQYRQ